MVASKIDGTKPDHFVVDELDCLTRIYTKEQLETLWESTMSTVEDYFKNYKPYIVYFGVNDGVPVYQINGDDKLFYITGREGAEEAQKVLCKAVERYINK